MRAACRRYAGERRRCGRSGRDGIRRGRRAGCRGAAAGVRVSRPDRPGARARQRAIPTAPTAAARCSPRPARSRAASSSSPRRSTRRARSPDRARRAAIAPRCSSSICAARSRTSTSSRGSSAPKPCWRDAQRRLGELVLDDAPLADPGRRRGSRGDAARRADARAGGTAVDARRSTVAGACRVAARAGARRRRWPDVSDARCSPRSRPGLHRGSTASRVASISRASTCAARCTRCSTGAAAGVSTSSRRRSSRCRAARASPSTTRAATPRSAVRLQEVFGLMETPRSPAAACR